MKIGNQLVKKTFFCGGLKIAEVNVDRAYSIRYEDGVPYESEEPTYYWLVLPFNDFPLQYSSLEKALGHLESAVGPTEFKRLKVEETSYSDVKEI